jgi:predicted transcriptional regulator
MTAKRLRRQLSEENPNARSAVARTRQRSTKRSQVPEPTLPLFASGQPDLAERIDDNMRGFGGEPDGGSYTPGMKTAVSVPNDVFEQAERLARRAGRSRSDVYSAALREYLARHATDELTATIDAMIDDLGEEADIDPFMRSAGQRVLEKSEW